MDTKDKQINLRVSKKVRDQIKQKAKESNYPSVAEYIINASLDKVDRTGKNSRVIYTLTMNPAVDYIISTENELDEITNFNPNEKVFEAGGKGINASIIMEEYGARTTAIHYSGGFSGELINQQLIEKGINNLQVKSKDDTRINLKLNFKDSNFEINSTAPQINAQARNTIIKTVSSFNEGDVLMIMGSYHEADADLIHEISKLSVAKGVELVYDLSKPLIKDLLVYKPLIIKPNREELEMIFGQSVKTKAKIIELMKELRKMGAKNVAVTMGKDGAYIINEKNEMYEATVDPIKLVSPQGSGDSFISTFVIKKDEGTEEAFRWANAAGAATAQVTGLANIDLIRRTLDKVKVKMI